MRLHPAGHQRAGQALEEHLCHVHGEEAQVSDLNQPASTAIDNILSMAFGFPMQPIDDRTFCSRIEETWRLWQKFLEDFSRFEDWLKTSERTAALPNSSGVLYTVAKEELKKFEACLLF